MKQDELKALMGRASDWHNAHPFEERKVLCISSMSQQITTLLSMKQKIQRMADAECRRIDDWVNNVARVLKKDLDALQPNPGPAAEPSSLLREPLLAPNATSAKVPFGRCFKPLRCSCVKCAKQAEGGKRSSSYKLCSMCDTDCAPDYPCMCPCHEGASHSQPIGGQKP